MPINPVALIAGALSFSAALAWNKAVSETLNKYTDTNSPMIQAIVITILIIIIVYFINKGLSIYTSFTGDHLKPHVLEHGGNHESKVRLWN